MTSENFTTARVTRRQCLGALAAGAAWMSAAGVAAAEPQRRRPNVILIVSDDHGSTDLGCYGATDLTTPHLDRLAARGVRFTQFYVGAPMCTASRAGLLTGRHFQRALTQEGLRDEERTLAELFRAAGYRTALYGKWHLGGTAMAPNDQGFDDFLGYRVGAIDSHSHFTYWYGPPYHALERNGVPHFEEGTYLPDLLVRESCRFIEESDERPFFLFLSLNQPHYPMQPEVEFRRRHGFIRNRERQTYAANIQSLDDKVGQVLARVEALGLTQDTIVLFLGDHGHSDEDGGRGGSAGPYRGSKFSLWEGGIRVPCIISGPGHIPEGEVRDQATLNMDWLPTLAGYCGLDPAGLALDGHDLRPVIGSGLAPSPHAEIHWMMGSYWAVRQDSWKLIVRNEQVFLVDLEADPGERVNVVEQHWDRADRMKQAHVDWLEREAISPMYTIEYTQESR